MAQTPPSEQEDPDADILGDVGPGLRGNEAPPSNADRATDDLVREADNEDEMARRARLAGASH